MKKIGILTFHEGINYGGFFQVFSTYTFLKEKGYEVEIINYTHPRHFINEKRYFFLRNFKEAIQSLKKLIAFKKALKTIKLSNRKIKLSQNFINNYDVIVVGSDIVWNYEWKFLGSVEAYVFKDIIPKKAVAFVPSCGFVDTEKKIPDFFSNGVKKFNHISVRDSLTQNIIQKCTGKLPPILLDPTFLIDFKKFSKSPKTAKPYILIYSFLNIEKHKDEIKVFAKKEDLEIIAVGYTIEWADRNISSLNPFEWLGLFEKAYLVYTSTFHGTLFSIHFNKKFITVNNSKIENKIKNIIELLKLQERVVSQEKELNYLLFNSANFKIELTNIDKLINSTKDFLISNL